MRKKHVKKAHRTANRSLYSTTSFRFLIVTTLAALFVLGIKTYTQNYQATNVLGASTFIVDNETPSQNTNNNEASSNPTSDTGNQGGNSMVNLGDLNRVEFRAENGNKRVNLGNENSSIEISSEGGKLSIKEKNANGSEVSLNDNSLEKINEALGKEDMEIATTSGNGFLIRKGAFEAKTHFPLSINPTTNQLTVTTPTGTKIVAVLPDEAVQNLLSQKLITSVASSSANPGIVLGLLNNQPAFQISGVDNKKLLGILPILIDKTSYVSAENGQVLQTNETFLNQLLDLLSTK